MTQTIQVPLPIFNATRGNKPQRMQASTVRFKGMLKLLAVVLIPLVAEREVSHLRLILSQRHSVQYVSLLEL